MDSNLVMQNINYPLARPPGLTFIPNMFHRNFSRAELPIDLCINTLSFAEMTAEQVEDYCASISEMIGSSGLFFEQNHQNNDLGLANIFPKYSKRLRKCETQRLPTYPNIRAEANIWVSADWRA